MKPQVTDPKPPQFQHDSIDPRKALLILGLPLAAATVLGLVLVASPVLWWIAAGVAAAGVAGGVLLRRSGRARGIARRLPGVTRAGAGLRRMSNGRFARSPLGRAIGRTFARPNAARRAGGPGGRPRGLGGRLRAALPAWAGGTRGRRPGGRPNTPGGSPAARAGGRARAAFARMMPGARKRAAASGTTPGGRSAGGRSAAAAGGRTGGRTRLLGGRPAGGSTTRNPSGARSGGRRSTASHGHSSAAGGRRRTTGTGGPADAVRHAAGGIARFFGFGAEVVRDALEDATETGTADACTTKVRGNRNLTRPGTGPAWPEVDEDEVKPVPPPPVRTALDPVWPTEDEDDLDEQPPARSQREGNPRPRSTGQPRTERDHDPPPSPPASPWSHREQKRETPRITSTNTGGRAMSVSPTMFNDLITTASTRREGWEAGANAFRRKAAEFEENAKDHDHAARALRVAGDLAAAEVQEEKARRLRDDANSCITFAGKLQEKANAEQTPAA